jgi:hypothetical protein
MKTLLLVGLITLFGPKPDKRNKYVGTYSANVLSVQTYKGRTTTNTVEMTLQVEKGSGKQELSIYDGNDRWTVTLADNAFTATPYKGSFRRGDSELTIYVTANGSFNGRAISYTETAEGNGLKMVNTITGNKN